GSPQVVHEPVTEWTPRGLFYTRGPWTATGARDDRPGPPGARPVAHRAAVVPVPGVGALHRPARGHAVRGRRDARGRDAGRPRPGAPRHRHDARPPRRARDLARAGLRRPRRLRAPPAADP